MQLAKSEFGRNCAHSIASVGCWLLGSMLAHGQHEPLYSTRFEASEGYNLEQTLAGQQGWVSINEGGNGLIDDFFEDLGRHAFVGFTPPDRQDEELFVFQPLDFSPIFANRSLVQFSVLMAVFDSTIDRFDHFRWSVFNREEQRLFGINFDNDQLLISYALDDNQGFVSTGIPFDLETIYELSITMNFEQNRWSARLGDTELAEDQPITTKGADLTLGDISAVWEIATPGSPGDNFMAFDNYTVTAEPFAPEPGSVEWLGRLPDGSPTIRVSGTPQAAYTLQATEDLTNWTSLTTKRPSDGSFDYVHEEGKDASLQFYRAILAR